MKILLLGLVTVALAWSMPATAQDERANAVRLVLQITIDGLRYDLLTRTEPYFVEGGLKYLSLNGSVFSNAHYQHANTETIVGHTTLATGAHPAEHGMIGNVWFDRETGELGYNVEDAAHPLLPTRQAETAGEVVDPARRLARTDGRSPRGILAETLSDRMASTWGGRSKIRAISGKDRGAIPLAGKSGVAYWMSSDTGDFISSDYYLQSYPEWVADWNAKRKVESFGETEWSLVDAIDSYRYAHMDDRAYETDLGGYGRVFPHRFAPAGHRLLPTQVIASPSGDALTADFAKALLDAEGLGDDEVPDYLSVSFSGVDAVSHFFGPSSLESEDMVRRLDRTLSDLLAHIDRRVGLDHTLIVLSADHGMPELPEYKASLGLEAGRLYTRDVVTTASALAQDTSGMDGLVTTYYRPYLYVNRDRLRTEGVDDEKFVRELAQTLTESRGIALAMAREDIVAAQSTALGRQIQKTFHPARAGDIYIVQDAYWFSSDKGPVAGMHGSPWRYDTHVPIIFVGAGIPAGRIDRRVHPVDVAPTIAALLGISPPAAASGTVLPEAMPR